MNDKPARRGKYVKRLAAIVGLAVLGLFALAILLKNRLPDSGNLPGSKSDSIAASPLVGTNSPAPNPLLASNKTVVASGQSSASASREFDVAVNPYAAVLRQPGRSKRAWESDFLQRQTNAAAGDPIHFELTGGVMASGVVKIVQRDGNGITYISGELSAPESGKFFFLRPPVGGRAGSAVGVIEFPASQTAYRIEPTGDGGAPELWQRRLDEVICMSMQPVDEVALAETMEAPPLRPDLAPEYVPAYNSNIVSLQSLPGARGVVFLDFFGGYTTSWDGVQYSAPNVGNAAIRDVWKRVAEDYMPLNINVTTDRKVYEAAPEGSRQHCAVAPDAPTAAGVAYYGSWNWSGDTVCWSKYTSGKASAEVVAHEVGHTLGLAHQTQHLPNNTTNEYYGGHNGPGPGAPDNEPTGWAPIMGAGYYQPVTTWAKGEFQYGGEPQDELATMITYNNVDYRVDDAGSTLAAARYLEAYSNNTVSAEGVIETTDDSDAFQFTTTGGSVSLNANVVGDWADLALMAEIQDSGGVTIASNNPQNVLTAGISTSLAAGTYTFRVTGMGRNDPLTNGFSSYASLGYYSITGSVAGIRLPSRFTVAERSPNGTVVGTVAFPFLGSHTLTYTITGGNSNNAFALDNNGVLTVANSTALLYANLAYGTQMTVQYELFVDIIDTVDPLQTELNRRVVVQVLDMPEPTTQLIHRWSFSSTADSVSGANATVIGSASISGGKLNIPGGAARANCATVNLTNTLRTNISLTVEGWFTMSTLQNWSKVWMFGRPNGGSEPGLAYMEFTPRAGDGSSVPSMSLNTGGRSFELNTRTASNPALLATGVEYHVVSVYDSVSNTMSMYLNGQLADSAAMVEANLTQLAATEAYFGAAVNYGDANLNGAINERSIYNGPVSPLQVAINYAAGPNNVVTNTGALLALRLLVATNTMARGTSQSSSVFADFANVTNVSLTSSGATFSSSNPGIVSVSVSGVLSAVGAGTATVTASYGGTNGSQVITVTGAPVLAHRWSFNDGTDSVGGANATLVGSASYSGGKLQIPGGAARTNAATVNIINTLAANQSLTIEGWFTMNSLQNWSKVWMFGTPNGGTQPGLAYVDFTPRRGDGTSVPSISFDTAFVNEVNTSAGANPAIMSAGVEYHAAAVYNAVSNMMYLYVNGALADSASMNGANITQLQATEAWFGAPVYWPDNNLNGAINEIRIWDGPLTSAQVATNYALGPNVLPRPTLAVAASGSNMTLSWPETFPSFTLQSSPVIGAGAVWTPVSTSPVLSGGFYSVTLPTTNPARFFRLTQ